MYLCNTIFLHSEIPSRMRPILSVKLRQVRDIVSAVVEEKKVTVYYRKTLDLRALKLFIRAFEEKYGRKKEEKLEDMDVATYRREAIISVGGFIAMNILRKVNPEFYGSMLLFRRLFTLYIARRYIKSGLLSLVKDHRANADTLTATAVAASVLSGKPESSLTLLALSNGAEMMTEYAAERARRQISGLLKLDQRDVWLIEGGREHKVPVESLKRGDLIAVHLGEKICVDGTVVDGNAAVNQASITGDSNPAMPAASLKRGISSSESKKSVPIRPWPRSFTSSKKPRPVGRRFRILLIRWPTSWFRFPLSARPSSMGRLRIGNGYSTSCSSTSRAA